MKGEGEELLEEQEARRARREADRAADATRRARAAWFLATSENILQRRRALEAAEAREREARARAEAAERNAEAARARRKGA